MVLALKELDNFSQEDPGAFYEDYVKNFGPPDYFARVLLDDLDPEVLHLYQRQRRHIILAVAIAGAAGAILALLLTSAFWYAKYKDEQRWNYNVPTIVGPAIQLTEEEMEKFWAAHPESDTNWSIDMETGN